MIKKYKNRMIEFAHDYFKEIVYQAANLEDKNITYVDTLNTLEFFEDAIKTIPYDKIVIITSLKKAYEYIIDRANSDEPITYKDAMKLNEIIDSYEKKDAGCFRNHKVMITGTGYIPKVYSELESIDMLNKHQQIKIFEDGAKLCAYWSKRQLFPNGNKRTSLCFANLCLIAKNINFIQVGNRSLYNKALISYYEDENKIDNFVSYVKNSSNLKPNYQPNYQDSFGTITKLTKQEQSVLNLISNNNRITAIQIGQILDRSSRQIQRIIASLVKKGNIVREGSNKTGS